MMGWDDKRQTQEKKAKKTVFNYYRIINNTVGRI